MTRVADSVLVSAYQEQGQTLQEIAVEWRMAKSTVKSRLLRAGVVLRKQGGRRSAVAELLKELTWMKQEATR